MGDKKVDQSINDSTINNSQISQSNQGNVNQNLQITLTDRAILPEELQQLINELNNAIATTNIPEANKIAFNQEITTLLKGFTGLIPEATAIIEAVNALAEQGGQLWKRLF